MKKRIIIFMPSIEGGGVEKNFFIVSNYLSKEIDNVSVITISKKYKYKFNKSINFISFSLNIWDKLSRRAKYFLAIILLVKEIFKNRNVSVFSFQANIYCIIICKLFFIKVISRSNSAPAGWSKNPIKRWIFKIFLNLSDKVMVNSLEFKKDLKKQFNVNAVCIYNPLNKKEIIKDSKKKINFSFFKKKTNNFITIGRLVDQKDHLTLLKAFKILRIKTNYNFKLLIIGRGENKNLINNYIAENNLSKFVRVLNFKNNPYPYLKKADALISTSIYEGLPNVLLEGLTLKKLIISSDCPTGPNEILDKGNGGIIFKMRNEFNLFSKIKFYLENKRKCKKFINYGYKRLDRFDLNYNLEQYAKLFET